MPVSGPIRPGFLRYHPHLPPPARAHSAVSGGVPVWQITLIAAATLLAAAIAVTVSGGGAVAVHRRNRALPAAGRAEKAHLKEPSNGKRADVR